jgi:FAD:protein FMN transferase
VTGSPVVARFAARAMGSPLRLAVVGLAPAAARRAWQIVVEDVESTEAALSRWREESGLSRVNGTAGRGAWATVDRRLYVALSASARAQRLTYGRFDPRVIGRLEALGERAGVPLPELSVLLDEPWLQRDPRHRRVRLAVPVDSGGIGKGLAVRWAVDAVTRAGLSGEGLLLEAGGDLFARGRPPEEAAWRIGIEDPEVDGDPLAVIEIAGGAVVTSSTAVRHWTAPGGGTVHHLIDPATGEPGGDGLQAVTLVGTEPAWAEVWSKALFLAGTRRIAAEARSRGFAAWWIEADRSLHMTPAARALTIWSRQFRAA